MSVKKWMTLSVFYDSPFWLYIGSIKTNHSLSIPALTGLLSLLRWAALITDGNSTILCVCVCVCLCLCLCVCTCCLCICEQACKCKHVNCVWEFNCITGWVDYTLQNYNRGTLGWVIQYSKGFQAAPDAMESVWPCLTRQKTSNASPPFSLFVLHFHSLKFSFTKPCTIRALN